jgi:hypothetical protein
LVRCASRWFCRSQRAVSWRLMLIGRRRRATQSASARTDLRLRPLLARADRTPQRVEHGLTSPSRTKTLVKRFEASIWELSLTRTRSPSAPVDPRPVRKLARKRISGQWPSTRWRTFAAGISAHELSHALEVLQAPGDCCRGGHGEPVPSDRRSHRQGLSRLRNDQGAGGGNPSARRVPRRSARDDGHGLPLTKGHVPLAR